MYINNIKYHAHMIPDCLNNQFMFYNYIHNINHTITQYLENNNCNINFYCIGCVKIGNCYYIITSKTIKRKDNGYRLIVIKQNERDECNMISENNIYYEDLQIIVGSVNNNINEYLESHKPPLKTLQVFPTSYTLSAITEIVCDSHFYSPDILENNITTLINYTDSKTFKTLKNVNTIVLRQGYHQTLVRDSLPESTSYLYFNYNYNLQICANVLPNSIIFIKFGEQFNQSISSMVLPSNLITLIFGDCYNRIIHEGVLPTTLISLNFGAHYNQVINKECSSRIFIMFIIF
jgi:hypothetical protein